jgi:hypothetical protein
LGDEDAQAGYTRSYAQLFQSGAIEAVSGNVVHETPEDEKLIRSGWLEHSLITATTTYLNALSDLGVAPPLVWQVALIGAKGAVMGAVRRLFLADYRAIDRNLLLPREILVERLDSDAGALIRPAIDSIWNACGQIGSPNYDEQGNWVNPA